MVSVSIEEASQALLEEVHPLAHRLCWDYNKCIMSEGWTTGVRFLVGAMIGFFLFVAASRLALGPT